MSRERFRRLLTPSRGPEDDENESLPRAAIAEDETMLPGGRAVPIDDLEESGMMSDALMRKATPSVYAAEHGGMSPGQVDIAARMQRPASDDFLASPRGPREDEVELPGGGQRSIDDLEMAGGMSDALRRKGRPGTFDESESPQDVARNRFREMLSATDPRVRDARRERYDRAQVRRIRDDDPDFGKGRGAIIRNSALPQPFDLDEEAAAAAERARIEEETEREELTRAAPEESAARADRARIEAEEQSSPRARFRRMLSR